MGLRGVTSIIGITFFLLALGGATVAKEATKTGVIVVDFQADFTKYKNGSLAVEGTEEPFIKLVEENTRKLKAAGYPIFGTLDWHPANHVSFFTSHKGKMAFEVIKVRGMDQVLWPPHCVQNTPGAEVLLDKKLFKAFVKTATNPQFEGYSGFQDDGGKKTDLDKLLKKDKIAKVVVYGIATDYCVRATALDAMVAGYQVILIKNLSRGVAPDTTQKALEEMKSRGVIILDDLDLNKTKAQ
jgi:nicotinamidase/pyrazinamidase